MQQLCWLRKDHTYRKGTYLCNGPGILHYFNDTNHGARCHAAIGDELQVQALLLPQLFGAGDSYVCARGPFTGYLCFMQGLTFSKRENILRVIMSCLRSSPNLRISRVGL